MTDLVSEEMRRAIENINSMLDVSPQRLIDGIAPHLPVTVLHGARHRAFQYFKDCLAAQSLAQAEAARAQDQLRKALADFVASLNEAG